MADVQPSQPSLEAVAAQQQLIIDTINTLWVIYGSIFVFFMQAGFAFLEAGSVRAKNLKNILLKNVTDTAVASVMWYAVGYALSFGKGNGFIGTTNFFLSRTPIPSKEFTFWLFTNAFAATASTIVSGALAERCRFEAYLVYTICISGFIYPTAAHWIWSNTGWLSYANPTRVWPSTNGLLDFAGSGTVHIVGGMCALVGASWLGPRKGRFNPDGTVNRMPGHSTVMATMGALILWTGWYAFNAVSTQVAVGKMPTASLIVVNTTLSASMSGIAALVIFYIRYRSIDIHPCINGILTGLAASSSTCSYVAPYSAVAIGIVAGAVYYFSSILMLRFGIDDPVDAAAIHLGGGVWGLLAAGLMATPGALQAAGYPQPDSCGAFYGCGGKQLGMQLLGCAILGAWSFLLSTLLFGPMKRLHYLRVSTSQEMEGLDVTFHGGKALYLGTHAGTLRSAGSMGGTSHLVGGSLTSGLAGGNGSLAGATNFQAVMKNASVHSRTAQNQDSVRFGTQDLRIAIPVAKSATPSPSPTNCGSGNLKSAREEINKSDRNKPSSPGGVLRASSTHSILKVRQPASQVSFDTEQSNKRRSVS